MADSKRRALVWSCIALGGVLVSADAYWRCYATLDAYVEPAGAEAAPAAGVVPVDRPPIVEPPATGTADQSSAPTTETYGQPPVEARPQPDGER